MRFISVVVALVALVLLVTSWGPGEVVGDSVNPYYVNDISFESARDGASASNQVRLRGIMLNDPVTLTPVVSYRGLRYIEPMKKRWEEPKVLNINQYPGSEVNATQYGYACPQSDSILLQSKRDEDCLYLNVWSPLSRQSGKLSHPKGLPVMVFFHGGAFYVGSSNDRYIDGIRIAATSTILVTVNYRLGYLGFLAHPALTKANPKAPANFGLLDQRAALRWVQNNIHHFGGDASQVTIFGESAGAMSVMWHLVAKYDYYETLFKRAIIQSSCEFPADSLEEGEKLGREIAGHVGCYNDTDIDAELECLRSHPAEVYVYDSAVNHDSKAFRRALFFHSLKTNPKRPMPLVDGVTFPNDYFRAFSEGLYRKDVDVLIGTTKDEGTLFTYLIFPLLKPSEDFMKSIVAALFSTVKDENTREQYIKEALDLYWHNKTNNTLDAIADMTGNLFFQCPTRQIATDIAQRSRGRVYTYVFDGAASSSMKSFHGSELIYVFATHPGGWFFPANFTVEQRILSENMVHAWTSFAATGEPKFFSNGNNEVSSWPTFDASSGKYVVFVEDGGVRVKEQYHIGECSFWKKVFPAIQYLTINELADEPLHSSILNGALVQLRYGWQKAAISVGVVALVWLYLVYLILCKCCRKEHKNNKLKRA